MPKSQFHPPKLATRFLRWYCSDILLEEIEGDLQEAYHYRRKYHGRWQADYVYFLDVLRFFKPYSFEPYSNTKQFIPMFKNYLKIAIRNIMKRKGFTAINLGGLTLSLSVVILIGLFLDHHLSYDRHYPEADQIYRIGRKFRSQVYAPFAFESYWQTERNAQLNNQKLFNEMPDIKHTALMLQSESAISRQNEVFISLSDKEIEVKDFLYTNTPTDFLAIFPQKLLKGSYQEFRDLFKSVLITESTAKNLFGAEWETSDVIGKRFEMVNDYFDEHTYVITGVIEDSPASSHFKYNFIVHVDRIPSWGAYTYVKTNEPIQPDLLAGKIDQQMAQKVPGYEEDPLEKGPVIQPVSAIHSADLDILYELKPRISKNVLFIFGSVALVILLITWTNYMNLSIAMYTQRQKEIGMRKVLGARRNDITFQLLTEIMLIALLAFPIALGAVYLCLSGFAEFMQIQLTANELFDPVKLGIAIGITLATGLFSGIYPALVFSRKDMLNLFKSKLSGNNRYGFQLRRFLIAFQFVLVISMISMTSYLYQQMQYIQNRSLGFEQNGVVSIPTEGTEEHLKVKSILSAKPAIAYIGSGRLPGGDLFNQTTYTLQGYEDIYDDANVIYADYGVMKALGIDHPAFERLDQGMDSVQLINRSMAEKFKSAYGLTEADLLGRKIISEPEYTDEETGEVGFPYGINGILPDMHYFSLKHEITPLIFEVRKNRNYAYNTVIRIEEGANLAQTMGLIEDAYYEAGNTVPFDYTFLDDFIDRLYKNDQRTLGLIATLSVVAIFLAMLGLASLVSFMVYARQKEIGIRKVFGASVSQILLLLNKEFVYLMIGATLLSTPLIYIMAEQWLSNFAYRITINPLVIGIAGFIALALVMLVVSLQSRKTARSNPTHVLTDE